MNQGTRRMMASTISSEVAAASFALPKIVPQAHHLARRLIGAV